MYVKEGSNEGGSLGSRAQLPSDERPQVKVCAQTNGTCEKERFLAGAHKQGKPTILASPLA